MNIILHSNWNLLQIPRFIKICNGRIIKVFQQITLELNKTITHSPESCNGIFTNSYFFKRHPIFFNLIFNHA